MSDRQFVALCDPGLAVELSPDGAVMPAKETGEPCSPARSSLVVERIANVPQVGGGHAVSLIGIAVKKRCPLPEAGCTVM